MYIYRVSANYGNESNKTICYVSSYKAAVAEMKALICKEYINFTRDYDYDAYFKAMKNIKLLEQEKVDKINPLATNGFHGEFSDDVWLHGDKKVYIVGFELIEVKSDAPHAGMWETTADATAKAFWMYN